MLTKLFPLFNAVRLCRVLYAWWLDSINVAYFLCRCIRIRAWISNGLVHQCGLQRISTSRWYIGLATATSHTCVDTAVATGRTITSIPCVVTNLQRISVLTGMLGISRKAPRPMRADHQYTHSLTIIRLLPRGLRYGTSNNGWPPAGTVKGDVGSLRQCCPQMFEIFAEDVTPSRARGSTGSRPSSCSRVEGVDGLCRMI